MSEEHTVTKITVIANGQERELPAGSSIAELLRSFNVNPQYVVVQHDGLIVPRGELEQTLLQEGSKLEIVTLVGGG